MEHPKISIITVVYNGERTIEDPLRSVAAQTYRNREHLVIDGASTDQTFNIIKTYSSQLDCLISEPDQGIYHAMNKGLALASGDVVGFLNSDDVYADNQVLEKIASAFQDPSVDACHGDLIFVDGDDLKTVRRFWKSGPYEKGSFKKGWMPPHPTFYLTRSAIEKYGGFDVSFKIQSDVDFTMRMLEVHQLNSVYIPSILVKMRMGGTTTGSALNVLKGNLEAYRACRKNGLDVTPFYMVRKIYSRLHQFYKNPVER